MIRAHMATFPPRRELMLQNIQNILPQVDRLFLVLNNFDEIPEAIAQNDKIEAVIPEDDLMDVGKFYFTPEPDDYVFTMDDDLVFPDGYVEYMMSFTEFMDFDKMLISLHGLTPDPEDVSGWKFFHFRKGLKSIRGVTRVGTGVSLMKGTTYPPLEAMRGAEGFVDLRFAKWQLDHGRMMWTVPRERGWVKGNAPPEIAHHAIFARMSSDPPRQLLMENHMLLQMDAPNRDMRFYEWKRAQK